MEIYFILMLVMVEHITGIEGDRFNTAQMKLWLKSWYTKHTFVTAVLPCWHNETSNRFPSWCFGLWNGQLRPTAEQQYPKWSLVSRFIKDTPEITILTAFAAFHCTSCIFKHTLVTHCNSLPQSGLHAHENPCTDTPNHPFSSPSHQFPSVRKIRLIRIISTVHYIGYLNYSHRGYISENHSAFLTMVSFCNWAALEQHHGA